MASLIPYLVFPGTCKEALTYYATILKGTITTMISFEESPIPVSSEFQKRIFDAELKAGDVHFKASDDLPEHPIKRGNNISLFLAFPDKKEKKHVFRALRQNGKVLFPLDDNFGMLEDQYGIQWMIVNKGK